MDGNLSQAASILANPRLIWADLGRLAGPRKKATVRAQAATPTMGNCKSTNTTPDLTSGAAVAICHWLQSPTQTQTHPFSLLCISFHTQNHILKTRQACLPPERQKHRLPTSYMAFGVCDGGNCMSPLLNKLQKTS